MSKGNLNFKDLILHEDNDYVVISKPAFISTLNDRVEKQHILEMAKGYTADAQVCHRLDKETSGALAIAKNPEAYRHLSMQFEHREVNKVYHAVVDGRPAFNDEEVDAPILKQNDGTAKISSRGKEAQTRFTTLQTFSKHALIDCRPLTGRMHQIRVHLASLGTPITGDEMYGGKPFLVSSVKRGFRVKKDTEEQPVMKRMALHAFSLDFKGVDGIGIHVQAPYPKDFTALVRQLSANTR
ncbi:MAG TPA: RNA pseudouridine synthase [Cyclobacteriaceae bacterium]|nr:RNA pseudouridine synthase [Cyclobacteriaceae bacterium]